MSLADIAGIVGAAATVLTLIWAFIAYGLDRIIGVRITGESKWASADGIRVEIANSSRKRSVQVDDVEVLHSPGRFRRRTAVVAAAGLNPATPWVIETDRKTVGWMPLNAVDGSDLGAVQAKWDFSRAVKVRAKLATGRRKPTSRPFRIERGVKSK